jgi:hypothetical protein
MHISANPPSCTTKRSYREIGLLGPIVDVAGYEHRVVLADLDRCGREVVKLLRMHSRVRDRPAGERRDRTCMHAGVTLEPPWQAFEAFESLAARTRGAAGTAVTRGLRSVKLVIGAIVWTCPTSSEGKE